MNDVMLQEAPMAKKVGRPPNPDKGLPVRIHPDVHRMAQRVADYKGETLADFLSNLMRPIVVGEFRKMIDETEPKMTRERRK